MGMHLTRVGMLLAALCGPAVHADVTPDELADLLDRMYLKDQAFETEYSATVVGSRRATVQGPWSMDGWVIREDVHLISTPSQVRCEVHQESSADANSQPCNITAVWDGCSFLEHVVGIQQNFRIPVRQELPGVEGEFYQFNLIEARYPFTVGHVRQSAQVRGSPIIKQSVSDGVLTYRYAPGNSTRQQNEIVVRLQPDFQFISATIEFADVEDAQDFQDHVSHKVLYTVEQWETVDGLPLPKRVVRDGFFFQDTVERKGLWMVTRSLYERKSLRNLAGHMPEAALFELQPSAGDSVQDERQDLSFTIGDREITVSGAGFILDEPIATHPGDRVAEFVAKAEVHLILRPPADVLAKNNVEVLDPKMPLPVRAAEKVNGICDTIDRLEKQRPRYDSAHGREPQWVAQFEEDCRKYVNSKVKLVGDLLHSEPTNTDLADLLPFRWRNADRDESIDVRTELDTYAREANADAHTIAAGEFFILAKRLLAAKADEKDEIDRAVDQFLQSHAKDAYGARLLFLCALREPDETTAQGIWHRLAAEFPDTYDGRRVNSRLRQAEGVGETFTLDFKDLISGNQMSIENLRGKVVLIQFWSTSCGPCIQEIPRLKQAYAKYHDRGVEFVGISLDTDPAKLLTFCQNNEMPWPQYCEPDKGWDTSIALKWGVNGIPQLMVLDKQGKVRSTHADPNFFDSLLYSLLKDKP